MMKRQLPARGGYRSLWRDITPFGLFLATLVLSGLLAWNYLRTSREAFLDLSQNLLVTVGDRVEQEVADYLSPAEQQAKLIAEFAEVTSYESGEDSSLVPLARKLARSEEQVIMVNLGFADGSYIMAYDNHDGTVDLQVIEHINGERDAYWVRESTPGNPRKREELGDDYAYDPRIRPWYQGANAVDDVFWTDVYIFYTGRVPGITAARTVRGPDGRGILGVVGIDIDMGALSQFLADLPLGLTGRAMIVDANGNVIASRDDQQTVVSDGDELRPKRMTEIDDLAAVRAYQQSRIEGLGERIIDVENQSYLTSVRSLESAIRRPWTLLVVAPEKEYSAAVDTPFFKLLALGICIAFVGVCHSGYAIWQARRYHQQWREQERQSQRAARHATQFARLLQQPRTVDGTTDARKLLTENYAEEEDCRRISLWELHEDSTLICLDAFDQETRSHTDGFIIASPSLVECLGEGKAIDSSSTEISQTVFHSWRETYANPLRIQRLVAAPIQVDDKCIGMACLEFEETRAVFPAEDLAAAEALALAAAALHLPVLSAKPAESAPESTPAGGASRASPALQRKGRGLTRAPIPVWLQQQSRKSANYCEASERAVVLVAMFDQEANLALTCPGDDSQMVWSTLHELLREAAEELGMEHTEHSGSQLLAASGIEVARDEAIPALATLVLRLRQRIHELELELGQALGFRAGIDSGLLLRTRPPTRTVFGEAVANARELATTAQAGTIQVSETVYESCPSGFLFRERGRFFLSSVGSMTTYQLES